MFCGVPATRVYVAIDRHLSVYFVTALWERRERKSWSETAVCCLFVLGGNPAGRTMTVYYTHSEVQGRITHTHTHTHTHTPLSLYIYI